ncbi:helix-turn-helix domain-containing protein [Paenibacillus yanchengensis]|uniref:Helix-turn-helix domain-containing protein n=1 Tax=Paenibacillus yanchengensis TaxID=2035833 RepID=A0ABW4YJ76_9BACL
MEIGLGEKWMSEIGYRIKCIEKKPIKTNQNQSQFSKSVGISQDNLSEIEMGNINPSEETLM